VEEVVIADMGGKEQLSCLLEDASDKLFNPSCNVEILGISRLADGLPAHGFARTLFC
jgi:hypothetical protein